MNTNRNNEGEEAEKPISFGRQEKYLLASKILSFPFFPLLPIINLLIKNIFWSNTYREFPIYTAVTL